MGSERGQNQAPDSPPGPRITTGALHLEGPSATGPRWLLHPASQGPARPHPPKPAGVASLQDSRQWAGPRVLLQWLVGVVDRVGLKPDTVMFPGGRVAAMLGTEATCHQACNGVGREWLR